MVDKQQCETLTLHVTDQWRGVGTALVEAVADVAAAQRCVRLSVTTTNDNVDALRSTSAAASYWRGCVRGPSPTAERR